MGLDSSKSWARSLARPGLLKNFAQTFRRSCLIIFQFMTPDVRKSSSHHTSSQAWYKVTSSSNMFRCQNKLTRSDVAIHLTLPYTLAPLLCLIFNRIIYNHEGGLIFTFLDYWWSSEYVYKIWLSLVQEPRISPPPILGG